MQMCSSNFHCNERHTWNERRKKRKQREIYKFRAPFVHTEWVKEERTSENLSKSNGTYDISSVKNCCKALFIHSNKSTKRIYMGNW